MSEYTLKLRRYQPESGEAAYWEEFTIDLDGKRSLVAEEIQRIGADGMLMAEFQTVGPLS